MRGIIQSFREDEKDAPDLKPAEAELSGLSDEVDVNGEIQGRNMGC